MEGYQNCSLPYVVLQFYTVKCNHRNCSYKWTRPC